MLHYFIVKIQLTRACPIQISLDQLHRKRWAASLRVQSNLIMAKWLARPTLEGSHVKFHCQVIEIQFHLHALCNIISTRSNSTAIHLTCVRRQADAKRHFEMSRVIFITSLSMVGENMIFFTMLHLVSVLDLPSCLRIRRTRSH